MNKNQTMRRQSLRPRQIDIHSKMSIIRNKEDLDRQFELVNGVTPAQSTTALSVDEQELMSSFGPQSKPVESTLQQKKKKDIPIPVISIVEHFDKEVPIHVETSLSYIKFQNIPQQEDDCKTEVDLSLADMNWLTAHPKYGKDGDPRYQLSLETFGKMMDILEKASGPIFPNLVSQAEAEQLFSNKLSIVKTAHNKVVYDVFNYWVSKREAFQKPLLRQFWPQTPLNDTNPHLVFRPREKERYKLRKHRRNDVEAYRKMQVLRTDFVRVRHLLKLILRRETCKRLLLDIITEKHVQTMFELTNPGEKVRIPQIPVTDSEEIKRRRKKKKSKKLRKDLPDSAMAQALYGMHANPIVDSNIRCGTLSIPTFMDGTYFNSVRSQMVHDTSEAASESNSMSPKFKNPFPSKQIYCRGRIGRGGRLLFDRLAFNTANEKLSDYSSSWSMPAKKPQAILPVEQSAVAPSAKPSRSFDTIYNMSDSEDELIAGLSCSEMKHTSMRSLKYRLNV